MGQGSGGSGPGTGKSRSGKASAGKKPGAGGGSAGGSGKSGGGSSGSGGGKGKGTGSAGTGGVTGNGGKGSAGGQAGGGNEVKTSGKPLEIDFGDTITDARKEFANEQMNHMSQHLLVRLRENGLKLSVADRADHSPHWAEYAKSLGITSSTKTADGRELGDLSFYHEGYVFVSDSSPHGSQNVYVHELAHAVDYHFLGKGKGYTAKNGMWVKILSDDPEFVTMHREKIFPNSSVRAYYRTGSTGDRTSGRRETFAEGYAEYVMRGRDGLKKLLGSYEVADEFIRILTAQGVIK